MMRVLGLPAGRVIVRIGAVLRRPEMMVVLPALTLAAFWLGGERALISAALGLPLVIGLFGAVSLREADLLAPVTRATGGMVTPPQIVTALEAILGIGPATGLTTACLAVRFDDMDQLADRFGKPAAEDAMRTCVERMTGVLRQSDTTARLDHGGLVVALGPVRQLDLETLVQMAARLQKAVSPPLVLDATQFYVTCSVGFCLPGRTPEPTGRALYEAAVVAADAAWQSGPGAIRSYSAEMGKVAADRDAERDMLETALDEGQIRAHFQPQVSTDTGEVTGFEALARWHHPERGLVAPGNFMPSLERAGLLEKLGVVILHDALQAITRWDKSGLTVPRVSVNFSAEELRSPLLPEKIGWALDRFDLEPGRLTIEILESVVTQTDNDVIVRNIATLSEMGCGIDLDDFGTGQTSLANIRRFALRRLKIDRSFVTRIDEDPGQQRICSAVLSMAERLGLETVAEGVETSGEQAMLAQLGFTHAQGFGIGRPMPFEETAEWMARHRARIAGLSRQSPSAAAS
jgi:EAL domain-containing protein (putative c-di-GMP-specific phosphodiesterase class I)/GGDEF domain-containing protein